MSRPVHAIMLGAFVLAAEAFLPARAPAAWQPTRPVEFAGTGDGADQMARTVQGIISKHGLMKQPLVIVNKAGGAGGEGFLDVKNSRGDPHKLVTLSNLFTTSGQVEGKEKRRHDLMKEAGFLAGSK